MTNHFPRSTYAALVPAFVAAVQLAAVTWVPIIHSQLEAQLASAAIEREHSPDCSETHHETSCASCGATLCVSTLQVRHAHDDLARARLAPGSPADEHPFPEAFLTVHSIRAPPLS